MRTVVIPALALLLCCCASAPSPPHVWTAPETADVLLQGHRGPVAITVLRVDTDPFSGKQILQYIFTDVDDNEVRSVGGRGVIFSQSAPASDVRVVRIWD